MANIVYIVKMWNTNVQNIDVTLGTNVTEIVINSPDRRQNIRSIWII